MSTLTIFCTLLILAEILGWRRAFLQGALSAFIVYGAYICLLHLQQKVRKDVQRSYRRAWSAQKKTSNQQRKRKRIPSATHPAKIPATLIPVSALPPSHPFFRLTMVPYATEANSRNRLLNLPAELRNKIYEYALYIGKVQLVNTMQPVNTPPTVLSLLQACHQTRKEAGGIFSAVNDLWIAESDFDEYFNQNSASHLRTRYNHIKQLTVLARNPFSIVRILAWSSRLDNLQILAIDVSDIPHQHMGDPVTSNVVELQRWIDRLFNLKSIRITTGESQVYFKMPDEANPDLQAMIDHRDLRNKFLAKLDARKQRA